MKTFLFGVFFAIALFSAAQLPIGHRQVDFVDASRSRTISCEIYYPGATAGENVACAVGTFPIIVFGHGYSMGVDAYTNFSDFLVPEGYIFVLPATETGLSPDHEEFGLDLKFINSEIKSEATTNASFFLYNHFNGNTALSGHSMGGGASFLAAAGNTNITTLFHFAAAETTPSAIAAAANISVPVLIFQGENDGVAPPADHQIPMYNALTTGCRYKINILGGGHCYFANSNIACSTAEFFTSPQPTISREEQHETQFDMLLPYLEWQLKENASMASVFEDSIQNSSKVSSVFLCPMAGMDEVNAIVDVFPNPATSHITIESNAAGTKTVSLIAVDGRKIVSEAFSSTAITLNCENLAEGIYVLVIESDKNTCSKKILIQRNF